MTCSNVFNVWPKTSLLLPVWPRDDTPAVFPTMEKCENIGQQFYLKNRQLMGL